MKNKESVIKNAIAIVQTNHKFRLRTCQFRLQPKMLIANIKVYMLASISKTLARLPLIPFKFATIGKMMIKLLQKY